MSNLDWLNEDLASDFQVLEGTGSSPSQHNKKKALQRKRSSEVEKFSYDRATGAITYDAPDSSKEDVSVLSSYCLTEDERLDDITSILSIEVRNAHFYAGLKDLKPSVSQKEIAHYEDLAKKYRSDVENIVASNAKEQQDADRYAHLYDAIDTDAEYRDKEKTKPHPAVEVQNERLMPLGSPTTLT